LLGAYIVQTRYAASVEARRGTYDECAPALNE
jgi:hypothetical protein